MDQQMNGDAAARAVTAASGVAALGGAVTVEDLDAGGDRDIVLVMPEASDPRAGLISIESPLGQALLGRHVGDVVEARMPARTLHLRVTALTVA